MICTMRYEIATPPFCRLAMTRLEGAGIARREATGEETKKFHPLNPPPAGDTKKHIMKNIAPYAIYKMENLNVRLFFQPSERCRYWSIQ